MKCPKCGIPMLQLSGWDFLHLVCFNPVHAVPVHYTETWGCGGGKATERPLTECEQQLIDERKKDLVEGLSVVKTNWELVGQINCFLSGGYNPEIKKRLEDKHKQPFVTRLKQLLDNSMGPFDRQNYVKIFMDWLVQKRREFANKSEAEIDEYSFVAVFDELIDELRKLQDLKNPKKYPCPKCGSQMTYNKLTAYDFIGDYRGFCCEKCNHEFVP